ncbi:MAG: hypothetical protein WCJ97_03755 [Phycisphaerae bacterium]
MDQDDNGTDRKLASGTGEQGSTSGGFVEDSLLDLSPSGQARNGDVSFSIHAAGTTKGISSVISELSFILFEETADLARHQRVHVGAEIISV